MSFCRKMVFWLLPISFLSVIFLIAIFLSIDASGDIASWVSVVYLLFLVGFGIAFTVVSVKEKNKVKIIAAEGESIARQHNAELGYVGIDEFIVLSDSEKKIYYKSYKNGNNELRQIDYDKLAQLKLGTWTSKLFLTTGNCIDIVYKMCLQNNMFIRKINTIIQISKMPKSNYRVVQSGNAEFAESALQSQSVAQTNKLISSQRVIASFLGYEGNIYCIASENSFVFPAKYELWKEGEYVFMRLNNIIKVNFLDKPIFSSKRTPNYGIYKFAINNIVSVEQEGDVHYTTNVSGGGTSVTGALVGGALFGGVGAILGGKKKITSTSRKIDERTTIIKLVDETNQYCGLKFAYNDYYALNKLINSNNSQESESSTYIKNN